jgi:predicted nucleic acid-binding protein
VIGAVLDTNVLVAAFQIPAGMCDKAFGLCLSGVVQLVTSNAILDEFEGVLRQKFGVSEKNARDAAAFVLKRRGTSIAWGCLRWRPPRAWG